MPKLLPDENFIARAMGMDSDQAKAFKERQDAGRKERLERNKRALSARQAAAQSASHGFSAAQQMMRQQMMAEQTARATGQDDGEYEEVETIRRTKHRERRSDREAREAHEARFGTKAKEDDGFEF